jgi:NNP family nitrate/nitrite transporter-like MFS transporter
MTGSRRATANLALATLAFALCFTAWRLIAPFMKTFEHDLGLDYTEALVLPAIPVLLGSLLRMPLGIVTDSAPCSTTRIPR